MNEVYVVTKVIKDNEDYITMRDTNNKFCGLEFFTLKNRRIMKVFSNIDSAKAYVLSKEDHLRGRMANYKITVSEDHTKVQGLRECRDYIKYVAYEITVCTLED